MTILGRALHVIGGLYNGNVQILPTKKKKKQQQQQQNYKLKKKKKGKTKHNGGGGVYVYRYLEIAVDLGEANHGAVFESSIGFSNALKGTHLE